MSRRFSGEIYVLAITAVVVVSVGAILAWQDGGSGTDSATAPLAAVTTSPTQTAMIVNPTPTERPPVTSTPASTTTTQPTATSDALKGARVRTREDAVARGLTIARGEGAEHPRLVSVEILDIDEAIAKTMMPGDDPGPPWAAEGAAGLAWVVQFDSAEFGIPSCEPPYDPTPWPTLGKGHSCGTLPTAIFVIRASDGSVISMALGLDVPR